MDAEFRSHPQIAQKASDFEWTRRLVRHLRESAKSADDAGAVLHGATA